MTKEEKLKIVNQYIGFGNPTSKIWFFGSEEKGEWTEKDIVNHKNVSKKIDTMDLENKTYGGYLKILNELFDKKHEYFVANLWPIGKDGDFSDKTKRLFEFNIDLEDNQILDQIKKDRFFALEMFFKLFNWKEK